MPKTNNQRKNALLLNSPLGYFIPQKRICPFCKRGIIDIDHKDVDLIKRFTSYSGMINGRRKTKACAKHQRKLTQVIKRARHLALIPFVG